MGRLTGTIGRWAIFWVMHIMNLLAFSGRLLLLMVWRPRHGKQFVHRIVIEQIYFTAVQALPMVVSISLLAGTVMLFQFSKIAFQYDLGKVVVIVLIRELGPLLTALIVLLRSGVAMTVEVSYMRILNEIESLEMAGIDPMHLIGYPRLLGITWAMLCMFIVFDLCGILGGHAIVWVLTDVPLPNLMDQIARAITPADIAVGILKALCFGVIITVTSLYQGFTVRKQVTSIPVACSTGAIDTLLYILIVNILISGAFYL